MCKRIESISERMRLSPYQSQILLTYKYKYNLDGLRKRGDALFAPHHCNGARGTTDLLKRFWSGPRADLIGSDRMLAVDQRGIKLYDCGTYRASDDNGNPYYADMRGQPISKSLFENILGL